MKATFVEELQQLAADCNVPMAKREGQLAAWANRWGAEDDQAIKAAFRFLREPGAVRGGWPTFHEMAFAMDRGKADVRRRSGTSAGAAGEAEKVTPAGRSSLRRLRAAMIYARLNNRILDQEAIAEGIEQLFGPHVSDDDIEKYIRENQRVLAQPAPEEATA